MGLLNVTINLVDYTNDPFLYSEYFSNLSNYVYSLCVYFFKSIYINLVGTTVATYFNTDDWKHKPGAT